MPEGDTIFRTATTLRRVLDGREITSFEAAGRRGPHPVAGERVTRVGSRGKHLLIAFDGGTILHTHMQMDGSWHVYRPGERWWHSRSGARVVIGTAEIVAVCFDAPVVELLTEPELERHPQIQALGPDLCDDDPDLDEAVRRLASLDPATPVGVAMLDQRVAAGVGNVYKSEVLFARGVDPFARIDTLDGPTRRGLFETASRLLRMNLEGGPRRTVREGVAVYERGGRPCRRCGTLIRSRRQGEAARTTWWCPSCQPLRARTRAGMPLKVEASLPEQR
jgi:endonuclease VIII